MFNEIMQAVGKLSTILQENLTGIQVVKGFAREPYEIDKYHDPERRGVQAARPRHSLLFDQLSGHVYSSSLSAPR